MQILLLEYASTTYLCNPNLKVYGKDPTSLKPHFLKRLILPRSSCEEGILKIKSEISHFIDLFYQ